MTKFSVEQIRVNRLRLEKKLAADKGIEYASKSMRNECSERACKRERQNGSSRCAVHGLKKQ